MYTISTVDFLCEIYYTVWLTSCAEIMGFVALKWYLYENRYEFASNLINIAAKPSSQWEPSFSWTSFSQLHLPQCYRQDGSLHILFLYTNWGIVGRVGWRNCSTKSSALIGWRTSSAWILANSYLLWYLSDGLHWKLHFSVALFEGQTDCPFWGTNRLPFLRDKNGNLFVPRKGQSVCPSKRATCLSLKEGNLFITQRGNLIVTQKVICF